MKKPLSRWSKFVLFVVGVILPVVCFGIAASIGNPFDPSWQDGRLSSKLGFMLAAPAAFPLYPFSLYSAICFTFALFRPETAQRLSVRLRLAGGVVLSACYWFILGMRGAESDQVGSLQLARMIGGGIIVIAGGAGVWWVIEKYIERFKSAGIIIGVVIVAVVMLFVGWASMVVLIGSLIAAPAWSWAAYLLMCHRAGLTHPATSHIGGREILGGLSWLAGFGIAWRASYLKALHEYSQLPLQAPGECYVCTAAAQGHARWVGADAHGRNDQMRFLKAAELAMLTAFPYMHRRLRRVYDALGPRLAAAIKHPLAADGTYVLLKPAEWGARIFVSLLAPGQSERANRIYSA